MLHGQDLVNRNDTNAMKTTILAILELQIKNWELIDK